MRVIRWVAVAVAAACCAGSARAAEGTLSLQEAIAEGAARSPKAARAREAASERSWADLEAASAFLPKIGVSANRMFESEFQTVPVSLGAMNVVFPEVFPFGGVTLDASWTVFAGFSGVNRMRASLLGSEAADLESSWADFQVRQDVRLKFCQALGQKRLLKLAEENVATLEEHLKMVKDLLAAGRATRFDLLRVEVQRDDARSELLAARDRAAMARKALSVAMGETVDDRELQGDLPEPAAGPQESGPVDEQPEVKAKRLEADAAARAADAAADTWMPRVSVVASYQWYDNGYSNSTMDPTAAGGWGTDYNLGMAASWDVFGGGAGLAKEMQASRKADEASATAKQALLEAGYDRELWRRRLDYATEVYRAKLVDVEKAAESVRLAQAGQQAGTRTTTEVLDAELDSFRASAAVVSAQMDAAEALIRLELALGKGE
jgi:outer membrane protein TolC